MFLFKMDQKRGFEVSRIIGSLEFGSYVRSAVEILPEYKATKEIIEKFDPSMAIRYVMFVSVNDWDLTDAYYKDKGYRGSEALWYASRDALIELRKFDVNKLTQSVLEKLRLPPGRRPLFENISNVVGSDPQVSALIDGWIKDKVIEEDSLRQALERIQNKAKTSIPVNKILNLITRTYSYFLKPRGFEVKARPSVLFDVHVAKITLRLGLVKAMPKTSTRSKYLPVGFPLTGNSELRQKVVEAWDKVSKNSGISAWDIDAALWQIGRNFCLFDDELLQRNLNINPNQSPKTSCPYRRLGLELGCPLREVCESYKGDVGLRILSQRVTSLNKGKGSEVVLFIDNLRKLL